MLSIFFLFGTSNLPTIYQTTKVELNKVNSKHCKQQTKLSVDCKIREKKFVKVVTTVTSIRHFRLTYTKIRRLKKKHSKAI